MGALTVTLPNLNAVTPAAPTEKKNVAWQFGATYVDAQGTTRRYDSGSYDPTGGVDARTTTTETVHAASRGMLVTFSNSSAIAVTLDSTVTNLFFCAVEVTGTGAATLTPSSGQINGVANLVVASGQSCFLFFDGTNWSALVGSVRLAAPTEIALSPSSPGNFTIAHGLGAAPRLVLIQMTSGGAIWFQSTRYDATNIYLVASDAGVTGFAEAWL